MSSGADRRLSLRRTAVNGEWEDYNQHGTRDPRTGEIRIESAINRATLRAEPRGQPGGAQVSGGHLGIDVWKCVMRSRRRALTPGVGSRFRKNTLSNI